MLTADLALELGLPCFPCRNTPRNEKTDKIPLTKNGFKDASADPNEIRKMFSPHPGCLIGVPAGSLSGIDILDVDPRHNGHVWYEACKEKLPPTRIHRTRRGGLHRLFKHRDGLRNTTAKIAPGIDTRCEGGYFIWWPATGLEFQDYPPAGLPEWPLWLLPSMQATPVQPPPPYDRATKTTVAENARAFEGIIGTVARGPHGKRNDLLFWGAIKVAGMSVEGKVALAEGEACLVEAATQAGLPMFEIKRTLASAFQRGMRQHG